MATILDSFNDVVNDAGEAIGSAANTLFNSLTSRKTIDITKYIPTTKMAYFYSPINNSQILLDSVRNVTYNATGNPTQSPVESGKSLVDNYILQPRTASFSGIIADTKVNKENPLSVVEYTIAVETLMALKEPFTFYCDDLLMPNIQNCLITNFSLTRDQSVGIGVSVDISVQEVLIIERAKPTTLSAKKVGDGSNGANAKSAQDKPNSSKGDGQTKEPKKSILLKTFDSLEAARIAAEKAISGEN